MFTESPTPIAICSVTAALTSFLVMSLKVGSTEFNTSDLTAVSTTLVVFVVNSLEISFRIFS